MSAIKCPFCQHENKPGTRFCSECGASIHLKICSNSACGKISDVGAAVCEFCGQSFPNAVESGGPDVSIVREEPDGSLTSAEKKPSGTRAWPLIMVALFAGGLPMLWANRAQLPTPKTWQMTSPEKKEAVGADPALSIKVEPPAPVSPAPVSVPAKELVAGDVGAGGSTAAVAPAEPNNSKKKAVRTKPATADTQRNVVKAPPAKVAEPPRPCTEATVALGLCDAKQIAR